MSKPEPPSFRDAIKAFYGNPNFNAIVTEFVERRETAIRQLGTYKDDTELRKVAAEIAVLSDLLDDFNVPTGTAES